MTCLLCRQERGYDALHVDVMLGEGESLNCRTYKVPSISDGEDKRPSPHYMDVIISGAVQQGMPQEYINVLKAIEHNNYKGRVEIIDKIGDNYYIIAE